MTQQVLPEKVLFTASKDPEIVEVPDTWCLTVSGSGAPESPEFKLAIEALYGLAYTLKFQLKQAGQDFRVPALEGLWWAEGQEFLTGGTGSC